MVTGSAFMENVGLPSLEAQPGMANNFKVPAEMSGRSIMNILTSEKVGKATVAVDSGVLEEVDVSEFAQSFQKADGVWQSAGPRNPGKKRHGVSGPIGDLFFAPQRFVFGTSGSDHENFVLGWLRDHVPGHFRKFNGGVHRGVFAGESWYRLPVVMDSEIDDDEVRDSNLVLYGSFESNAVLRRFRDHLPVDVRARGVEIAGRAFEGELLGFMCLFPHPENPDRYLAMVSGTSPEAVAGCSHLNLQLLPDYVVWRGAETWWGFFDNDWR